MSKNSDRILELNIKFRVGREFNLSTEKKEIFHWNAKETICILVDLWDKHWCTGANERLLPKIDRINDFLNKMRSYGTKIIHAPSDTMKYYQDWIQRKNIENEPKVVSKINLKRWENQKKRKWEPLPFKLKDDGCSNTPKCKTGSPWRRQHPDIQIEQDDLISDKGEEIYSYIMNHNVKNIIYLGVHLNMCILGRSFGMRKMKMLGLNGVFCRDLTDIMFKSYPKKNISHEMALNEMIEYVEYQFYPSILSNEIRLKE